MATANNKESSGESSSSESDAQPPAKVQKISVQAQQQIKDRLKVSLTPKTNVCYVSENAANNYASSANLNHS